MSDSSKSIFIFTKDRPSTLSKTLRSLSPTLYPKLIVDDSSQQSNQSEVENLADEFEYCKYLARASFREFCVIHKITFPKFSFLLRELGSSEWNLGYARNFALLYAKAEGFQRVLFMDDDIQVPKLSIFEELFSNLNSYKFTGANIKGLIDDSVLGHVAASVQVTNKRMLSGGFMALSTIGIDQFFLNNYNEDWIWLFMQLKNSKYLQKGQVFQALVDPFANYEDKVIFQEFGEIVLDGVLDLYEYGSYDTLTDIAFWQRMIRERREYLELLEKKSEQISNEYNIEILKCVKGHSKSFTAELFKDLFHNYFENRKAFLELYQSL